ncbi:hypothetical protein GLOTRDRAFT_129974 [Gloeophyllum trabeum ATCC 11539]|uniref:UspA domain-containing protein n=1 Tax=Gloeophyllum trabeum (strain ATCC 11539 / FP-39264 / Madison 617) TaxID=670483 RepID=S7Q643_GLOTA|nr:uncharacterized protein GLOTRDRAFT_129974 [Gloeophyllum trabeum ATCC 11539]EPQ54938.1 hypothetical protein GLOTRDRAFT_129974 [Gloeophyllum trabeum ATCC 11539]
MSERAKDKPSASTRRLSWKTLSTGAGSSREAKESWTLVSPQEGQEVTTFAQPRHSYTAPSTPSASSHTSRSAGSSPTSSRSATPLPSSKPLQKRWSSSSHVLTRHSLSQLEQEASQLLLNALERTNSLQDGKPSKSSSTGSFGRMSLSSMMGGLSALSLTRSSTDDKERGRSLQKDKGKARSSSVSGSASIDDITDSESSSIRARSQSPFRLRRTRARDPSPAVCALTHSDAESDTESTGRGVRPRTAFVSPTSDEESGSETEIDNDSDDSWGEEDHFDFETERNTERNALIPADRGDAAMEEFPDPLGEGVNVVVPPEPYFPSTLNPSSSRRKNSKKHHDLLPLQTSRPIFQRDRCTITITHGDPARALEENGRRPRRYVVASDLSEESRYAVEWGIGTVLRDGDEMLLVTVVENESKVDPAVANAVDRAMKLRNQQERQALAYILVRQVTGLLQRTRLNVTVACQAWHAKNHRHMLLDIVDYFQPSMMIVGSRGLGQLKGILLGSTSHYLIQKCSVPVMVARRRLKRPPRKFAHLAPHRARVSLAQAGIDRVAPKVDHDVQVMRDEIQRDDESRGDEVQDDEPETEIEGDSNDLPARKVAGE